MDFNRVFSQAISRTVNKCYAEESEISVAPFLHWSFNPLIPPGCIPFLELAGLESGKVTLPTEDFPNRLRDHKMLWDWILFQGT